MRPGIPNPPEGTWYWAYPPPRKDLVPEIPITEGTWVQAYPAPPKLPGTRDIQPRGREQVPEKHPPPEQNDRHL